MNKFIIIGLVAIMSIMTFFNKDQGTRTTIERTQVETIRGDVSQLQGKSTFYHNRFGSYPILSDNVYDMNEGHVIWGLGVLEKYFGKMQDEVGSKAGRLKYIEDNIKVINLTEMKDQDLTYELANEDVMYYLDILTGKIIAPELMEEDENYRDNVTDDGSYRILGPVKIIETDPPKKEMNEVHGSIRSGSTMYFYGKGQMMLARRDENTNIITNLDSRLPAVNGHINEILYVQPTTNRASVVVRDNPNGTGNFRIEIIRLDL